MSDRYRRGIDIAERLATEKLAHFVDSGVAEVAPDFARMIIEFAFGDLYSRDALDLRSRELVAIAALAATGKAEITEILMQIALYAGFPAALNALADCHNLLTDRDCLAVACSR